MPSIKERTHVLDLLLALDPKTLDAESIANMQIAFVFRVIALHARFRGLGGEV